MLGFFFFVPLFLCHGPQYFGRGENRLQLVHTQTSLVNNHGFSDYHLKHIFSAYKFDYLGEYLCQRFFQSP